jgi:hypothetical protein
MRDPAAASRRASDSHQVNSSALVNAVNAYCVQWGIATGDRVIARAAGAACPSFRPRPSDRDFRASKFSGVGAT